MYVPTFQGLTPTFARTFLPSRATVGKPVAQTVFPFDGPHVSFYRARNAIFHLFKSLTRDNPSLSVLMPDYNSGNEVLAIEAAGAQVHYYPVGPDGQVDVNEIERLCRVHQPDVLYVIHFLGWAQPMRDLVSLARTRGMWLVEDCALALLSAAGDEPLGTFGDWSVFCLYKTLPLPNGACLVQNTDAVPPLDAIKLRPAGLPSVLGRTADLMVKHIRSRRDSLGAAIASMKRAAGRAAGAMEVPRAKIGDIGFDLADVDLAMSDICERVLARLDLHDIKARRIENYTQLDAELDPSVERLHADLPDGVCPLFYPVLVQDKHAVAECLRAEGIDALEFWNHGADLTKVGSSPNTRALRERVLGLPIHQDLTPAHISHVARHVSNLASRRAH